MYPCPLIEELLFKGLGVCYRRVKRHKTPQCNYYSLQGACSGNSEADSVWKPLDLCFHFWPVGVCRSAPRESSRDQADDGTVESCSRYCSLASFGKKLPEHSATVSYCFHILQWPLSFLTHFFLKGRLPSGGAWVKGRKGQYLKSSPSRKLASWTNLYGFLTEQWWWW